MRWVLLHDAMGIESSEMLRSKARYRHAAQVLKAGVHVHVQSGIRESGGVVAWWPPLSLLSCGHMGILCCCLCLRLRLVGGCHVRLLDHVMGIAAREAHVGMALSSGGIHGMSQLGWR